MNYKITTLLLLTFLAVDSIYGQRPRKLSPKNNTSIQKVDVEIQKQLSLIFEAKELQTLINEPTIRIKQFDNINKNNFKTFKIKSKSVDVLDANEIAEQNNANYFYFVGWSDVLNMLDIEMIHQATKTKVKILLTKKGNDWVFGTSELVSDKKPEQKDNAPARRSLRRRG